MIPKLSSGKKKVQSLVQWFDVQCWFFLQKWKRSDKRCEESKRMVDQSSSTGSRACTISIGQTQ